MSGPPLRDLVTQVCFRHTTSTLAVRSEGRHRSSTRLMATVSADTTEPTRPGGRVTFYVDG